ncbi:MAG: phytanoyl-CoA dioxygenase family protein [Gemmatimonadetes bacterium]|nr:phytanoyl-CoA dioxygenase family protein [Gemmatimonadota bacterium]
MLDGSSRLGEFAELGYAVVADAVAPDQVDALIAATEPHWANSSARGGVRHALRNIPEVRSIATSATLRALAEAALGPGALPVRGLLFDKTPDANWRVIWHQDLTIAVRERRDAPGFGPWSEKDGAPHVQPPVALLERMVAVRVHLDDCTTDNGPVRVIPGSHRAGRHDAAATDALRMRGPEVTCVVPRGGVLAFHSLLLHASSPAVTPAHRRVVHIEYVGAEWAALPHGLAWDEATTA